MSFFFSNPGEEFEPFTYPQNQSYTVIKHGGFSKKTLPLNDVQRLWSSIDAAVIHTGAPPFNESLCNTVKGSHHRHIITYYMPMVVIV